MRKDGQLKLYKSTNFLIKKGFKKFLIISGIDQSYEENLIKDKFRDKLNQFLHPTKQLKMLSHI